MKRKLISTVAVAALAMFSVPAFANTVNLGLLSDGYSTGGSLGSVFAPKVIEFTIATAELLTLSATVSNTSAHMGDSRLVLTGPTDESAAFVHTTAWNASLADYPGVRIAAGDYSFTINPPAVSGSGATGAYSLTVTGVPEISTWLMMLAGFGALGFVGYRRQARTFPV
jgi:hypothetical protein